MNEELYAVWTNEDLTEGRGREYMKYVCRSESTAHRLARRGYVQGSDCPVSKVDLVVVDEKAYVPLNGVRIIDPSPEDLAADDYEKKRQMALEKAKALGLSDDEIKALSEK